MVIRKMWTYMLSLVVIPAYSILCDIIFGEIYLHTHIYNLNLTQNLCTVCSAVLLLYEKMKYSISISSCICG